MYGYETQIGDELQNLASDSRSKVWLHHFGLFRVGTLPIVARHELSLVSGAWEPLPVCVLNLYDHTYDGYLGRYVSKFKLEVEFHLIFLPRIKIVLPNLVWNRKRPPQHMEWSKYAFSNIQDDRSQRRPSANRYNWVADCPISLKLYTFTDTRVSLDSVLRGKPWH